MCHTAMAFTNRLTLEKPGSILGLLTLARSRASASTPKIPTLYTWRRKATFGSRTNSGASFAQRMEARTGRRSCIAVIRQERVIWFWILLTQTYSMQVFGRSTANRGRSRAVDRAVVYSNRQTEVIPGQRSHEIRVCRAVWSESLVLQYRPPIRIACGQSLKRKTA